VYDADPPSSFAGRCALAQFHASIAKGSFEMLRTRSAFGRTLLRGGVVALASLALVVPASGAQTPTSETAMAGHPAHIHSGTCDTLGEVVYPLSDVAIEAGDMMGSTSAHPVEVSETIIADVPLQEILDGEYAVNVHLSADDIGTYIACGNIGGVVSTRESGGGNEVTIGLAELNDSGYAGTAWLGDSGDGGTIVGINLINLDEMSSGSGAAAATPAA
jgi:hypothetical protein